MSFFLLPLEQDPRYGGTGVRPKYVTTMGVDWTVCRFGVQVGDPCIVKASTTPAQDAAISANADAVLVPPLDNTIPNVSVRDTVRNAVESLSLPAQWVTVGMSYRTIMRVLAGMANIMQGMRGQGFPTKLAGNLDKTMAQFSAAVRNALAASCAPPYTDPAVDVSSVTGSTTLREVLRIIGEQFAARTSPLVDG